MEIQLFAINKDLNKVIMPITAVIGLFTSVGYRVGNATLLASAFDERAFAQNLPPNSILLTDFDDEDCLKRIRRTLDNALNAPKYRECGCGYYLSNNGKRCYIINAQRFVDNAAIRDEIIAISDLPQFFNVKLFTSNLSSVLKIVEVLPDFDFFDFSYFYQDGDMLLTFAYPYADNNIISKFKLNLYQAFGDCIYNDLPVSILDSLCEILSVRNQQILIIDNSRQNFIGDFAHKLLDSSHNISLAFDTTFRRENDKIKYLSKHNLSFACCIGESDFGLEIEYFDDFNCKKDYFDFKSIQKSDKNYFFQYFLYNILHKIKKSTW